MAGKKVICLIAVLAVVAVTGLLARPAAAVTPLYTAFLIADQSADITSSSLAYNSTDHVYLAVWCHHQANGVGVFARTISETGVLGSIYPVSDTSADANRCDPDVAYDPNHNNFLVVWQLQQGANFNVHGRLFYPGTLLGNDISFSDSYSSSATPPAVSFANTSDEFLVVWSLWSGAPSSIIGQRLTYDGVKLGGNLVIAPGHDTLSNYDPDIAYNISRNEYLLVYTRLDTNAPGGPNKDIFGWRLTHDVIKLGSELEIAFYTPQENNPSVAALPTAAPESGRYLVAYQITYDIGDSDIWSQVVYGDGTVTPQLVIQGTNAFETLPAVAASPSGRNFLVTWTSSPAPDHIFTNILASTVSLQNVVSPVRYLGGFFAGSSSVVAGRQGDFLSAADDITLFGNRDLYGRLLGNRIFLPVTVKH